VHPGGPFWKNKDEGAWSIPKGEIHEDEDPLGAAKREFQEETGLTITGHFQALEPVRQAGGKIVFAWAVENDFDSTTVRSNTFSIEWPKGSKKLREFPEIDRGEWFPLELARNKILKSQSPLLQQLQHTLR
jgi:predicted NUDIX family NTP pyrophosphohydrolase